MNLRSRAACLLALIWCAGCLRYIPSRREIEANDAQTPIGGPKEFAAHETALRERLVKLTSERAQFAERSTVRGYRVGEGDLLAVEVFGLSELSGVSEVGADGAVTLPYVGPVDVAGQTIPQIRSSLTELYKPYVREPRIRVSIKDYVSNTVSVIGAVAKPGVYALKRDGQTLTEFLSMAGGRTDRAGARIVVIPASLPAAEPNEAQSAPEQNTQPPRRAAVEVDVDDLIGGVDRTPLQLAMVPGDTIVVPEAGTYKVDGEVIKGGSFPLTGRTSALAAVAAAGGLSYSANVHEVEIIRDIGEGRKASVVLDLEQIALNGAQDVPLRDGDIVRVPSDPGRFGTRQVVEAVNGFFRASVNSSVRY